MLFVMSVSSFLVSRCSRGETACSQTLSHGDVAGGDGVDG